MLFMSGVVMLLRLFIAALLSPEGKGLTSWLLFVMFIVILLLSHLVFWDRCGTLFVINCLISETTSYNIHNIYKHNTFYNTHVHV